MRMDGTVHPDFANVARTFRHQLQRTTGGAAVAVYHHGELVVDLWGGTRDDDEPWEADTLAMCFSTTKGITSTALHLLADRGLVDYDERVATYWPEFAQSGKGRVTVRQLMSHAAGLHRIRTIVDRADRMLDWEYMVDALAGAEPAYQPGTANGYHALTYGWLVGEVVRRVDGRDLATFVQEELAVPLGLDGLFLGCPPEQRHRVAPLTRMGHLTVGARPLRELQRRFGEQAGKALSAFGSPINPRRMINALAPRGVEDVLWDTDVMDASIPAANGFFDARSLAKVYAVLAGDGTPGGPGAIDGVRLLSPGTVDRVGRIQTWRRDLVLVVPMRWRLGYHLVGTTRGVVHEGFGHFGFGGSGAWCDPSRGLAVAMVCNRGIGTPVGDLRLFQLGASVMDAVGARTRRAGLADAA